ncbi:MAG: hypothetical protein MUC99_03745 [Anaerolineae bacterium]|nr:hypothetical protein [Anaerolineae bacterium]
MAKQVLKIGLFVGREWSFPPAFIEEVNRRDAGVVAEYMKVGGTMMDEPTQYRVIIDRISHEVPYYRSYLKNAALQGVKVINDPFMWSSDDKFFGASLAAKLGVAHPRTVVLPNHSYVPGIVPTESLRNLIYPLEWDKLVDQVGGFPVILKDAHGGGWQGVYVAHTMEELWHYYNQSGLLTMVLQEYIQWDNYARVMALGQSDLHIMKYKPGRHGSGRYFDEHDFSPALYQRIYDDSLKLVQALGYDMNTVEFAIRDGVPYAIDFMNPAPDMDVNSLGKTNFEWMVSHMADMAIRFAKDSAVATGSRYYWYSMISGEAKVIASPADAPKRGRPRKPDAAPAADSTPADAPKRGRGRPKKDADAPAKPARKPKVVKATASVDPDAPKRGRGRPKKDATADSAPAAKPARKPKAVKATASVAPDAPKRGRGRPKKDATAPAADGTPADAPKRGRGRPKKDATTPAKPARKPKAVKPATPVDPNAPKRGRGRPKKEVPAPEADAANDGLLP